MLKRGHEAESRNVVSTASVVIYKADGFSNPIRNTICQTILIRRRHNVHASFVTDITSIKSSSSRQHE